MIGERPLVQPELRLCESWCKRQIVHWGSTRCNENNFRVDWQEEAFSTVHVDLLGGRQGKRCLLLNQKLSESVAIRFHSEQVILWTLAAGHYTPLAPFGIPSDGFVKDPETLPLWHSDSINAGGKPSFISSIILPTQALWVGPPCIPVCKEWCLLWTWQERLLDLVFGFHMGNTPYSRPPCWFQCTPNTICTSLYAFSWEYQGWVIEVHWTDNQGVSGGWCWQEGEEIKIVNEFSKHDEDYIIRSDTEDQ